MVRLERTQIYLKASLIKIDKGFLINQPCLQIINTVATLTKNRTLPILVFNNTNKFIKIYGHGLIAKITGIQSNATCINSVIKDNTFKENLDLKDLDVPEEYRSRIEKLVVHNNDLFASKDSE